MQTTKKTEIVRDTVSASMRTDTRTEIQEKYFRMRMDLYLKKRYKKLIGWEFLDDKEIHFLSSCNRIMLHLREDDVAETVPSLAVWEDGYRRSEDEIPVNPEDNNNSTQEDNEVIKWITDNIGTIEKEIQKISACCVTVTAFPTACRLIFRFWQNTQPRAQPEKNTVPEPCLPEMQGSSHGCRAALAIRISVPQ